jgi:penicillin amidase
MVFADRRGVIGRLTAATLPVRRPFPRHDFVRDAADPAAEWGGYVAADELPAEIGGSEDLIVSANDRPPPAAVPIGFLFDCGDRAEQLRRVLERSPSLGVADLVTAFDDTSSPTAARLARRLVGELADVVQGEMELALQRRLVAWDGSYDVTSSGAVAFELLLAHLVPLVCRSGDRPALEHSIAQWNFLARYFEEELDRLRPRRRRALLRRAVARAARDAARYPTWGDLHRVRVAHILADLPLIGGAYVLADEPSPGSRQTPYKTTHGLVRGRHATKFGAMARHVSDLADPDANWFVLFGGQDEWLGSPGFADQVPLWRSGGAIRMPLRPAAIAEEFPILTLLRPDGGASDAAEADALARPA